MLQLHDREALLPRERQRRFLEADGWVAWPGPALAEFLRQFIAHNRHARGRVRDRGPAADAGRHRGPDPVRRRHRRRDRARRRRPRDPPGRAARRRLRARAFRRDISVSSSGRSSNTVTWPTVAAWVRWRAGDGELPRDDHPRSRTRPESSSRHRSATASVTGSSSPPARWLGVARSALGVAERAVRGARELSREAAAPAPAAGATRADPAEHAGLARAARSRSAAPRAATRCSSCSRIGRTRPREVERADRQRRARADLDRRSPGRARRGADGRAAERAGGRGRDQPDRRGRGAAASRRRPAARGGARAGRADHRRPRARRARRGARRRRDVRARRRRRAKGPRRRARDRHGADRPVRGDRCRAGTGRIRGAPATLPSSCSRGEGENTRASRITNRRWAQSAFGTASAAALGPSDTVYSVTPLYHPSGLMMSIGGAIAGGARLAMARRFDAATFWEEVRRYGVTVASYTWTMLHELVDAPPQPGERHHPVRLFIGSGMPRDLWRRVEERFSPRACSSSTPRPRPARSSSTFAAPSRVDGPPLARQRRGADRRLRRRDRAD